MKLTADQVNHIARLSRLALTSDETALYTTQLSKIIEHVEQLNSLDTSTVEPTSHIMALKNVMSDDRLRTSLSREAALGNAPDSDGRFYRVPKIIE